MPIVVSARKIRAKIADLASSRAPRPSVGSLLRAVRPGKIVKSLAGRVSVSRLLDVPAPFSPVDDRPADRHRLSDHHVPRTH
ncbi:hypothetical protein GCM10017673_29110 [Streptosporangium violaceochromogenes]|nr:hypothetical protein GCM10017673_29110 [Streptosporangium violaceochromogenes]